MRILLVIDSLAWGGSQRQMANLAAGLQQRGHDVRLFEYYPELDHYRHLVEAAGVTLIDFPKRRKFEPGVVAAIARAIRDDVDAVVAFLAGPSAYAVLGAQLAGGGVPVVVSERGSFRPGRLPLYARLQRVTHRRAAHVTANSHHQRERMQHEFPWLAGRISTIWNGIDTRTFRPVTLPPRGDDEPLRMLGVGTVVPIKDIETLAHGVVGSAQRGDRPLHVSWAGKRLDSEASLGVVSRVDALLAAHGLAERWSWLGLQEDVAALYAACDWVVHPSPREGLPNAVCEALACGRPVVAPRAADNARLLGTGERGLLFEPGRGESLADALGEMIALGEAGRAAMGARGRAFAEQALSLDACVEQYETLLQRLVAERARRAA